MRILIIIPDKRVGGGQIFALRLAEALAVRHAVFILAAKPEWRDESQPEIPENVTEIVWPQGWISNFLKNILIYKTFIFLHSILPSKTRYLENLLKRWRELLKEQSFGGLLNNYQIDIVNTHVWWADYFASKYLDPGLNIPWIITMHGCYEACVNNPKQFPDFKEESYQALSKAKRIIFISDKNLEIFEHFIGKQLMDKTLKIYNGFARTTSSPVDLTPLGVTVEDFIVGIVSRAIPEKGWEEAIVATNLAREETGHSIHLFLVGQSAFQEELAQKYDWPFIHFVGHTPHPLDWIYAFDVGLLPTYFRSESLPNSVVEYLACGKPVVATNIGEIGFMIDAEGEKAGQLIGFDVDGRPDVNALKDAIVRYVLDSHLLKEHSKIAESAFAKFDMERCITAYEDVFQDALSKRL